MILRIAYDISAGLAQGGGIGRYTRELALALHQLSKDGAFQLHLYANRQPWTKLPTALATAPRHSAPLGEKLWRAWLLSGAPLPNFPGICNVIHGTDVIVPHSRVPAVITVHDLTPIRLPEFHSPLNRTYLRIAFPVMLRRAAAVIAVSEATRADLVNLLNVDPNKIHRIYEGVDPVRFSTVSVDTARSQVATVLGIEGPYILALGTLEPRKNLRTLLNAYARLPIDAPPLVLAGAKGWGDAGLAGAIDTLELRQRVLVPGHVPDNLLAALYAAAELFVYPSYYEGFGLPVLEAMTCGAPVITSNCSSLPEVAGDAAILVDPSNAAALAAAMTLVINTPELRDRMRMLGIEQARKFSWQRAARQTAEVYRQVVAGAQR